MISPERMEELDQAWNDSAHWDDEAKSPNNNK